MIKNLPATLPEIGKIKIGKKGEERVSKGGKPYRLPQKLDHFVVTTMDRDGDGDFRTDAEVMKELGDKPTELDVFLLFDDIELNFPTCYALYEGRRWVCRCDGVIGVRRKFDAGKNVVEQKEIEPPCFKNGTWNMPKGCKPNGILNVVLANAQQVGGFYKFRTTSWNSVKNLIGGMHAIRHAAGGILAGIPLKLALQAQTVEVDGKNLVIYAVKLLYSGSVKELREIGTDVARVRAQSQVETRKYIDEFQRALPAPDNIEEEAEIAEEFYPGQVIEGEAKETAKEEAEKETPKAEEAPAEKAKEAPETKVTPEGEQAPGREPEEKKDKKELF